MKASKKLRSLGAKFIVLPLLIISLTSCQTSKPEPIKLNSDPCNYCGMTISNPAFAGELITSKGRFYKFDDIRCMANYKKDNKDKLTDAKYFISDFINENEFISVDNAVLIQSDLLNSPMGGNIAAFKNKESADLYISKYSAHVITWKSLNE